MYLLNQQSNQCAQLIWVFRTFSNHPPATIWILIYRQDSIILFEDQNGPTYNHNKTPAVGRFFDCDDCRRIMRFLGNRGCTGSYPRQSKIDGPLFNQRRIHDLPNIIYRITPLLYWMLPILTPLIVFILLLIRAKCRGMKVLQVSLLNIFSLVHYTVNLQKPKVSVATWWPSIQFSAAFRA